MPSSTRHTGPHGDCATEGLHEHPAAMSSTMDECDRGLLRTYVNSPRIWDAASLFDTVMRLVDKGLIEPVDPDKPALMQITEQGRAALETSNPKPVASWDLAPRQHEVLNLVRSELRRTAENQSPSEPATRTDYLVDVIRFLAEQLPVGDEIRVRLGLS